GVAETHRFKIKDPTQQCGAGHEIVRNTEIGLPARTQRHCREMPASRTASYMDPHGVTAKLVRMQMQPGHCGATLTPNSEERHMWGECVVDGYHARSRPS